MITEPISLFVVLLAILAVLFGLKSHPKCARLFDFIPLLLFVYFIPMLLSTVGIIPRENPAYDFIKTWFLPASLILLTLSVDLPAIARLGKYALILFFAGTVGIVLGGPLAYAIAGGLIPSSMGDQAWKGLAALSGSWIGGGANYIAIGESVGATDATMALMVIPDIAVSMPWMAILFYFAGRQVEMDAKIGADTGSIDHLKKKIQEFQEKVNAPTEIGALFAIVFIGLGGTLLAREISPFLGTLSGGPSLGTIVNRNTWIVLLVTALGVGLSFTRVRNLEGKGASAVGSVLLYLLVAKIGAGGDFTEVTKAPGIMVVTGLWIVFHALFVLWVRKKVRAPIFFAAVGSEANIGAAASAPVMAAAFYPSLAPVGVLLGVLGYVVGTVAGLLCATLLQWVYQWLYLVQ